MNSAAVAGRVLIVDDDPLVLKLCDRVLSDAGFEATPVLDGFEAIRHPFSQFDVVLSDIQMPRMDGLQLLRMVRKQDLDLPVVLMTGAPSVSSAARAVEYGALRYVIKPIRPKDIVDVTTEAVRLHRMAKLKREALALNGSRDRLVGDRAGLEATFDRAMSQLWIAYQPIVSPRDNKTFGYEALMRSEEPALPHPGAILDAAERLDHTRTVGRTVRGRVSSEIPLANSDATIFVNLHPQDLLDETFLHGGDPLARQARRVILEITERVALDEVPDVRERLSRLREQGFRLAIDDLGAGYAGLTSLAAVEPDIVKLDMSLIRNVDTRQKQQTIVSRMTALAHELGMGVVAEGVETEGERDVLTEIGCDYLQGFLFARPARAFPEVQWA